MNLRQFIEIEIVSDDFCLSAFGEFDEFEIDLAGFGKVFAEDFEADAGLLLQKLDDSRPRRPRLRLAESEESATNCNSCKTNRGTITRPSKKPDSAISTIRPSIKTLVSRIFVVKLEATILGEETKIKRQGLGIGQASYQTQIATDNRDSNAKKLAGGCLSHPGLDTNVNY